jgi:hypothetical protein
VPEVQLLTIPCYAVGGITCLIISHLSDKTKKRGLYVTILSGASIIGYGIMLSNAPAGVHYFG